MIYSIEVFQIIKRWDDEVSKALMLLTVKLLYSLFLPLKDKLNKIIYYMPGTGLNPITKKLKLAVLVSHILAREKYNQ